MLKSSLNECSLSISSDCELAIINSIEEIFPNCKPQGCYFHLCLSFWRQVQTIGLVEAYDSYASFRRSFKLVQALPLLPVEEVINGLKIIKTCSNQKFKPILSYFDEIILEKLMISQMVLGISQGFQLVFGAFMKEYYTIYFVLTMQLSRGIEKY
ncbi:unnamed protein product, partial [Brachionus calyciflorus]